MPGHLNGVCQKVSRRESFLACAAMTDHCMTNSPTDYIAMGLRLFKAALIESKLTDARILAFEWARSSSLIETQDITKMLLKLFNEEEFSPYKSRIIDGNIDHISALAYYFDSREQELKQNLAGVDICAASHGD